MDDIRTCTKCGIDKPNDQFWIRSTKGGVIKRKSNCVKCCNAQKRIHYEIHRERIIARQKEYVKENAEACRKRQQEWYARNKEKCKATTKLWYENNKASIREKEKTPEGRARKRSNWIKTKYGISQSDFEIMNSRQGGVCAICQKDRGLVLNTDHCHKTGAVRGLLCRDCNVGLGFFKDSQTALQKAISYLSKHTDQETN